MHWVPSEGPRPADIRRSRFNAVLRAALNTQFYGQLLKAAALGTPEEISGLTSVDEGLARLPSVDTSELRIHSSAFLNQGEAAGGRRELFWPLPPAARTAVLMDGFWHRGGIEVFRQGRQSEIAGYAPEALAGSVSELRVLAEAVESRGVCLPRLTHSVIAFVILRQGFLSDEVRELFWRVYQVPVFGQILSPGGGLLAWECEAHDGFHIDGDRAVFETRSGGGEPELLVTSLIDLRQPVIRMSTALMGRVEHSTCGCGYSGLRLMELHRRPLPRAKSAAAFAGNTAG